LWWVVVMVMLVVVGGGWGVGGGRRLTLVGEEEWRRISAGDLLVSELLGSVSVVTRAWPGSERGSSACVSK
jgi:hypothetical protein